MKQIDIDFDGNQSTGNARIFRFVKGTFWSKGSAHVNGVLAMFAMYESELFQSPSL